MCPCYQRSAKISAKSHLLRGRSRTHRMSRNAFAARRGLGGRRTRPPISAGRSHSSCGGSGFGRRPKPFGELREGCEKQPGLHSAVRHPPLLSSWKKYISEIQTCQTVPVSSPMPGGKGEPGSHRIPIGRLAFGGQVAKNIRYRAGTYSANMKRSIRASAGVGEPRQFGRHTPARNLHNRRRLGSASP